MKRRHKGASEHEEEGCTKEQPDTRRMKRGGTKVQTNKRRRVTQKRRGHGEENERETRSKK